MFPLYYIGYDKWKHVGDIKQEGFGGFWSNYLK
jgi:hypothetical protein